MRERIGEDGDGLFLVVYGTLQKLLQTTQKALPDDPFLRLTSTSVLFKMHLFFAEKAS